jgi:hypothetical protein
VLVVPPEASYIPPSAIAVAADVLPQATPPLLGELLSTFTSALYLFQLSSGKTGQLVEIYRCDSMHTNGETFHLLYQVPVNRLLSHSLENFIEVNPIHLLAVTPSHGIPPERWLLHGTGKDLIFDIRIPLLVFPENHRSRSL